MGGGAMRTAAKVTGFSFNGVFRGNPSRSLPDAQTVAVAARRASNPAAAAAAASVSSSVAIEDVNSAVHNLSLNGRADASIHRPSWESDWDFADDGQELLLSDSMHTMPRVVFGGVPTLEEAKEATSELKDALEGNSSMISHAEYTVTKACITSDAVVSSTSVPNPVFRAFSLLKESPEAQNVVASLASDKKVWDAVMQNEKVMEFLKLQQTSNELDDDQKFPEGSDDNYDDAKHDEGSGNIFMESIQKIMHTVTMMMNDLSTFVQNLFGGQEAGNISVDDNGNASVNKTVGASFMALAVLAIMVVVLKRG